jgi:hypothetical protein
MSRVTHTWKDVEGRIAKALGTRRTPLSGGNSAHTRSDTLHPRLFVEIKHGASVPGSYVGIVNLFLKVERLAISERKEPVLVLHEKGRHGGTLFYPAYVRDHRSGVVICVPLCAVTQGQFP